MGQETKISPEVYARWRESELGARTEALEKEAVFALTGNLNGLRVLGVRGLRVPQCAVAEPLALGRSIPVNQA